MNKSNQIQIDKALFWQICSYFIFDGKKYEESIKQGLEAKIDALARRQLYTQYRMANTEEERNEARLKYLDSVGIQESFRW